MRNARPTTNPPPPPSRGSNSARRLPALTSAGSERLFWFAVPNGGWRSPTEAKIFKGLGVVAGVPDVIAIRDGRVFGLEIKADTGRLSPVQKSVHEAMRNAGAEVATAIGIDEALQQLGDWGLLR
jgi:hypothetical protein